MTRKGSSGSVIQVLVAAAVALVAGLALGGLAPRSELRLLRAEVEQLQERDCKPGRGVGREIASAFAGRPWQPGTDGTDPDTPTPEPEAPSDDADEEKARPSKGPLVFRTVEPGKELEDPTPEEIEESMEMARDTMRLRMRQAQASLEETAAPTAEQQANIDAAIADMNTELRGLAEEFVATMKQTGGEPSRRDALVFASETLDTLIAADDRIFESLTPEQIENAEPEALDPFAYVDPGLLDVFLALEEQ